MMHGRDQAPGQLASDRREAALDRLLRPRSIAIVGASSDLSKTAGRPIAYLCKHSFAGRIYPVNPRASTIGGLTAYPSVDALPETPDAALVMLGPAQAREAVAELAALGTGAAIVLASGYGESGAEGAARQAALLEAAGSMRLLGPNTIGLVNLTDRIVLSASGALEMEDLPAGHIGLVSQSGGILGSLLSRAVSRGIGFSKLISTGNECDIDVADCVEWLVEDEATRVIALYVEGLRKPARFRAAAAEAARRGKRIVVYKVGRSEAGARSAVSHTGALAGADGAYDALFRQAGVLRADSFADLLDVPAALATGRRLQGRRVAVLTSTGGAGTLVADNCGLLGLSVPEPGAETTARLAALPTDGQAVAGRNPVDLTLAGLKTEVLSAALDALLESQDYDAVVAIVGSSALAQPDLLAGVLRQGLQSSYKPLLAYVSPHAPDILKRLNVAGIPAFSAPESCAAALQALLPLVAADAHEVQAAPHQGMTVSSVGSEGLICLDEAASQRRFADYDIPVVRQVEAATPEAAAAAAASFGEPVVLKVLAADLPHKTEAGGVAVGVPVAEVAARCRALAAAVLERAGVQATGFLVQERIRDGMEMIVGVSRDPQLGMLLLVGMGGVAAELHQDTAMALLPLAPGEAGHLLRRLRAYPLLSGYRGRPPADVGALVLAIEGMARMALALGDELAEAEINPLFVREAGQGVVAADGVLILRGDSPPSA